MVAWQSYVPNLTVQGLFSFIAWIIIIGIIILVMGVVTYIVIDRKRFNKEIIIFEKVNNNYEQTVKDRALEMKIGKAGDTIFYLKKHKKYLPRGTIQTGRKKYWYGIREDGEWINIGIEDIDFAQRKVHAKFLDKEMRHSRTALQNLFKSRFDKVTWLQKYGGMMAFSVLIICFGVAGWLFADKMLEFAGLINTAMETSIKVIGQNNEILARLDNLCSTSGIKPAG